MGDGRPRNHKRYVTDEDHGVVANLERARLPLVFSLAPKKDPVPFWRAVDDLGSAFSQLQHLLMADETSNAIGLTISSERASAMKPGTSLSGISVARPESRRCRKSSR
jgi:hypothetical protein